MNTILYTIQTKGFDLTKQHQPLKSYTQPGGPFYEIAQYLGWESWLWCFADLNDYRNDLFRDPEEYFSGQVLWVLSVPEEAVMWCPLNVQCENELPVHEWFHWPPDMIRALGDIPQGLVQAPVAKKWVVRMIPAEHERACNEIL